MITAHFLAQWAVRSSILIAIGALLVKLLRVVDPAVHLAAWTAMLGGSLAIPLLTISLPGMPVSARIVAIPAATIDAPPTAPAIAVFRPEEPTIHHPKRVGWARAAVVAYESIAALLLLRLALAVAMSWRLLHRSRPTHEAGVRESDRIASPVTLGIVRPIIVLPLDWRDWDAAKLAAVLAHERSHIRRHDPAVQLLSAIHRSMLWYSPLSWYLDRQVVRLAEQASDDAAVATIRDRASYAEMLLEFMQRGVRRTPLQGVPMARYAEPEQRIHRILDATTLSRGVTRSSVAAILALGLPLAYVIAAAQERPTFEAASIRPYQPVPGARRGEKPSGGPGTTDPGRIHYPMVTPRYVLIRAYDVSNYQIVGPDWLDREFFDIDATMAPGTTKEQFQKMLQNLFADRFKMVAHRETREFAGYSLVVAKNGPKLKESKEPLPASEDDGAPDPPLKPGADGFFPPPKRPGMFLQLMAVPNARATFQQVSMQSFAANLQTQMRRPVIDETGLTAKYDFALNFSMQGLDLGIGRIPVSSGDPDGGPLPDIPAALQGQLGLRLEPKKVSQEVIVIDRMEKSPTEN